MSIRSNKNKTKTINSNILNSDNINVFEHLVKPVSELRLDYRLSDFDRGQMITNGNFSECYRQFKYNYYNGMNHDLVILCKTEENKVFGLYVPRINYTSRVNDKLKPYIFSLDMNETIGNKPNSFNNGVYVDFDGYGNALIASIEGYDWKLFDFGDIEGAIEASIATIERDDNIAYDMFSSSIIQLDDIIKYRIEYIEIEIYQVITKDIPLETSIPTVDNKNIIDQIIPFKKLKLVQALTETDYYVANNVNFKELSDVVIIIRTLSGRVFGVYRKDYKSYLYSVDLNETYPLTYAMITLDVGKIIVESNELYLNLTTGADGNTSYIQINNINSLNSLQLDELIGETTQDFFEMYYDDDDNDVSGFKWFEIDVYEIQ